MNDQPESQYKKLFQVGEPIKYIARNIEYEINIYKITIPNENETYGYRAYISMGGKGIGTKNNLIIPQETRDEDSIITELTSKAKYEIDQDNLEIYRS